MWPLRAYQPETVKWRRRAWYYRQVLACLGRDRVTGFKRAATPGETKPIRWTPQHHHVLADAVDHLKRQKKCADVAALRLLLEGGYFTGHRMTLGNAKKLLQSARRLEKGVQRPTELRKDTKKK